MKARHADTIGRAALARGRSFARFTAREQWDRIDELGRARWEQIRREVEQDVP